MRVPDAIAHILKAEGVEYLLAYPVNQIIESCADANIKPIIVRQERIGLHMADAMSRLSSGNKVGVFACQNGPGAENAMGAVAQAYSESVPLVVLPGGAARANTGYFPNFSSFLSYQQFTKTAEQLSTGAMTVDVMRRAFSNARNGKPGPCLVEVLADASREDVPEPINYVPTQIYRSAPNPSDVDAVAAALVAAERGVIYSGQGVHYARAWDSLMELAELLEMPVTTSLEGKSSFPENHPLSLGSGGAALPATAANHVADADVIFGVGCSFARTGFGIQFPAGKTYLHATNDPSDINKDIPATAAMVGDAGLCLKMLVEAVSERLGGKPRGRREEVVSRIKTQKEEWLQAWSPKLTSNDTPINPYRVIWEMMHTLDIPNTVITHDAGSPRDQLSPFWEAVSPQSYIGWGKSTQLGYGLGLAMGAKLAEPNKLCMNVWGDAAIGMTGMDFETAARNNIPIMSILFNNFSMAMELPAMPISTAKFNSTDISGNYADFARALGGYGERITDPSEIVPALKRGVQQTMDGRPVLLEFITQKEIEYSRRRPSENAPPRTASQV